MKLLSTVHSTWLLIHGILFDLYLCCRILWKESSHKLLGSCLL
uniref:Uncharacterized protein n=1 Tax=Arundo donax TaxID=35708 RepID=A0A0A9GNZ6_ARUDO